MRGLLRGLLGTSAGDAKFRAALGTDPVKELQEQGLWNGLPGTLQNVFRKADPIALKGLLDNPALDAMSGGTAPIAAKANIQRFVQTASIREAEAFLEPLRPSNNAVPSAYDWGKSIAQIGKTGIASGSQSGALNQAMAEVAYNLAKDATYLGRFQANPEQTLGKGIWGDLATAERALLSTPEYLDHVARMVTKGMAGEESLTDGVKEAIQQKGVRDLMRLLAGTDPASKSFFAALALGNTIEISTILDKPDGSGVSIACSRPATISAGSQSDRSRNVSASPALPNRSVPSPRASGSPSLKARIRCPGARGKAASL